VAGQAVSIIKVSCPPFEEMAFINFSIVISLVSYSLIIRGKSFAVLAQFQTKTSLLFYFTK